MSQQDLEKLYYQIQEVQNKTDELNQRLKLLEEEKDKISTEEFLEKFERIRKEAQELNLKKDRIGIEIEKLSPEYDS